MKLMLDPKLTKRNIDVDKDIVLGNCCEPDCGISVPVEKDMLENGRKVRCTACIMRMKFPK